VRLCEHSHTSASRMALCTVCLECDHAFTSARMMNVCTHWLECEYTCTSARVMTLCRWRCELKKSHFYTHACPCAQRDSSAPRSHLCTHTLPPKIFFHDISHSYSHLSLFHKSTHECDFFRSTTTRLSGAGQIPASSNWNQTNPNTATSLKLKQKSSLRCCIGSR